MQRRIFGDLVTVEGDIASLVDGLARDFLGYGSDHSVLAGFAGLSIDLLSGTLRQGEKTPDRFKFWLDDTRRKLTIEVPDESSASQMFILRTVRNFLIVHFAQGGFSFLHGSGIASDRGIVLFLGDKFAGKTTTMLRLLENGFRFHCNDLAIVKADNGKFFSFALPYSLSIREKSLSFLATGNKVPLAPREMHPENMEQTDGRSYLLSRKVHDVFGVRTTGCGIVHRIYLLTSAPTGPSPCYETALLAQHVPLGKVLEHQIEWMERMGMVDETQNNFSNLANLRELNLALAQIDAKADGAFARIHNDIENR